MNKCAVMIACSLALAGCWEDTGKRVECTEDSAAKAGEAFAFCLASPQRGSAVFARQARECGEGAFVIYCRAELKTSHETAKPK